MTTDDRVTDLEHRVSVLEHLILPLPAPAAPDVFCGYWGCSEYQIDETAGYATVMHDAFLGTEAMTIAAIKRAAMPTIITVQDELFAGSRYRGATESQALLRAKFNARADAGALDNTVALLCVDEPENKGISADDIRQANQYLRWVMQQFPALDGKPLWINYGPKRSYPAIEDIDWGSIDDYGPGSSIFTNGEYDAFAGRLKPGARTVLIPAGADSNDGTMWRADPGPFITKAKQDPRVAAIIGFIYISPWGGTTGKTGIRDNGMAPAYSAAFNEMKTFRRAA